MELAARVPRLGVMLLVLPLYGFGNHGLEPAQQAGQAPTLRCAAAEGSQFEVELLTSFARLNKLQLELVPAAAVEDATLALVQGRAQVAAGGIVAGRSDGSLDVSIEVFPSRAVVLTRPPAARVEFIEGLRGVQVGFSSGNAITEALAGAKVRASSLSDLGSAAEVLAALKAGRVGAGVVRLDEALRARLGDPELQLGVGVGVRQSLVFAVRKTDAALLRSLNQHLVQLRSSPSWGILLEKHFGRNVTSALARARLGDAPLGQKP